MLRPGETCVGGYNREVGRNKSMDLRSFLSRADGWCGCVAQGRVAHALGRRGGRGLPPDGTLKSTIE